MADLKISELPELLATQLQGSDPIAIVDLSGSATKKVTTENFIVDGIQLVPDGSIPPEKLSGSAVVDGSITTAKLADKSVTAPKLADSSATIVVTTLPASGEFIGQQAVVTSGAINIAYVWDGTNWVSEGGIQALTGSTTGLVNTYITTSGFSAEVSADIDQASAAGQFLAGPASSAGPIEQRNIAPSDLPTAGIQKGGVAVNGNGLKMDGDTVAVDNTVPANATQAHVVRYNEFGLVTAGAPIAPQDLPLATDANVGVVIPGDGLSVDIDGALHIENSVVPATATKITYDTNGLVIAGTNLLESDIPDLSADKITTGEFDSGQIAAGSITREKLANYSIAYIQEAEPNALDAGHIGVLWFQESTGQLRMYNGNSFMSVGFGRLSTENLRWGGIIDADTGLMTGVTGPGTTAGLTVGAALPAATDAIGGLYVLVGTAGSNISVTPAATYDAGDWCLCINEVEGWVKIDIAASGGGGGGGASLLGDLLDVTLTSPTTNQYLQLQATNQWTNVDLDVPVKSVNGKIGDVVLSVGDLDDVTLGTLASGNILSWNGSEWVNTVAPPADISGSSINALNDVDTSGKSNGDYLYWDQAAGNWVAGTLPTPTGVVEEVIAGDSITVDNTDPAKPVVGVTAASFMPYNISTLTSLP